MTDRVSSPLATGGAGSFFERDVAAYWLTQLLLSWIPPILIETKVVEVSFQTEHLGWKTDDFLITCEDTKATHHKLAGQVKSSFTLSAADEDCCKAILDFWQDFKNPEQFSPSRDRLVLAVQRGTDSLLGKFGSLLDCARASRDGNDFAHRLSTSGLISKPAIRYADEVAKILAAHEGRAVRYPEIWPFLKALHILSLDLGTSTRQVESHMRALLAYTGTGLKGQDLATDSWARLKAIAEPGMSQAQTFRREDLPEQLRNAHGPLNTKEETVLHALMAHTTPITQKIRSTIGATFHLPREALVQNVLDQLESTQVVIVSGAAGSGKSAIAKEVFQRLGADHFAFAFRAEEFGQSHIDGTLQAVQIPGNWQVLASAAAAQGQKVLLIESMERLLERSTREAFGDLLGQVKADPDLRVIVTCRNYSTDQVRESFLRQAGLTSSVVPVPPLSDPELDELAAVVPELARPLGHPPLRNILRNPYFLDKALLIAWPADRPLPESERDFRLYFWKYLVRVDQPGFPGSGRQREQVLEEIAMRRARALSDYVLVGDLDPGIVASLRADSLVIASDASPLMVATAHDVLEDWAILEWFNEQHLANSSSFAQLEATVGTHPAVRRSYRKWVTELLEREPAAADRLFLAATSEEAKGAQFRDDTLVSILQAPLAPALLERHEAAIIARNCVPLRRLIHLLRVACVALPDWLRDLRDHGSLFNVPVGDAWPALLKMVQKNLHNLRKSDGALLLRLVEDAVRAASLSAPEPPGEAFIAGIAYELLSQMGGYSSDDSRHRVLKVILKIPKADPAKFEQALRGTPRENGRDRDRAAEELQKLIYVGTEGAAVARDLPKLVVSVADEYLLTSDVAPRRDIFYSSIEVDLYFGIKDNLRSGFSPASALRGPWLSLFTHHPRIALDAYFRIFSHSIEWYVHPRGQSPLEDAWEVELPFADGTTAKQWVNWRLWGLYRAASVGPYCLQSMLMSLEKWLLALGKEAPDLLDGVLLQILRNSRSGCLSAVVASVATAYPQSSAEALLVLIGVRHFIQLDHQRMGQELQTSRHIEMFAGLHVADRIYEEERRQSNALPHRRQDLEVASLKLQLTSFAPRVTSILDQHLAALPAEKARTKEVLVWQLAVTRMDLRHYTPGEPIPIPSTQPASTSEEDASYVPLEAKPLEPAVQALVDEGTASAQKLKDTLGLWMWADRVFEQSAGEDEKRLWREMLAQARVADRSVRDGMGSENGPGCVAAVCVRDHWEELAADERQWCTNLVCAQVLETADLWADMLRGAGSMGADRQCAFLLPTLLTRVSEAQRAYVVKALVAGLTHPNAAVSAHAAWGMKAQIWEANRDIVIRCINTVALHCSLLEQRWEKRDPQKTLAPVEVRALFQDTANEVRHLFETDAIPGTAGALPDLVSRTSWEAGVRILIMLHFAPDEAVSVAAFEQASQSLAKVWDADSARANATAERHFESEQGVQEQIQRFAMRASPEHAAKVLQPILNAVERHPDQVASFFCGLVIQVDRSPNAGQFWKLWDQLVATMLKAPWIQWLESERAEGASMLSAVFLTSGWREDVRHWDKLEGYAGHVDALFEALPKVAIVLGSYLSFLYHIGERSLPAAFPRIAAAIAEGHADKMLRESNTVYLLEVLLQRHVYTRPLELKQDQSIRESVLSLLDVLVEQGSSAAFRMRDDFVTPISPV